MATTERFTETGWMIAQRRSYGSRSDDGSFKPDYYPLQVRHTKIRKDGKVVLPFEDSFALGDSNPGVTRRAASVYPTRQAALVALRDRTTEAIARHRRDLEEAERLLDWVAAELAVEVVES